MVGKISAILMFLAAVAVGAGEFSKTFNADYPVYGFDRLGYEKSPTIHDLTLPENFLDTGNQYVTCEKARLNKDGDEFTITLLLTTGITRATRMEVKFRTEPRSRRNYPTSVSIYNFSTKKNDHISYSGREERLERILARYIELMDIFYNKEKLLR
jgi:hypothetical protein